MKRLLPLILLLLSTAVFAESGAYRVEVIVFRLLASTESAADVEALRSFSHFPDLQEPRAAPPIPGEEPGEPVSAAEANPGGSDSEEGGPPLNLRHDLPDDVKVMDSKGNQMDHAWRRLRSSSGYRPLIYASWEQNRTDYYPPMRIHNDLVIDSQLRPPTSIMVADLASEDPLAAYRTLFYQIDGTVQLRRSRFLHLYLDLEYREPRSTMVRAPSPDGVEPVLTEQEFENNPVLGLYTLLQNRQIQTGRLQYFDTPYLGALVLVSAIAP